MRDGKSVECTGKKISTGQGENWQESHECAVLRVGEPDNMRLAECVAVLVCKRVCARDFVRVRVCVCLCVCVCVRARVRVSEEQRV